MSINDPLLKEHMRIDNSSDDELIADYEQTAINYIVNAVGGHSDDEFYQNNHEFNLAVRMLTDQYYRERGASTNNKALEVAYGVQSIILQLKPAYKIWRQEQDANCSHRKSE